MCSIIFPYFKVVPNDDISLFFVVIVVIVVVVVVVVVAAAFLTCSLLTYFPSYARTRIGGKVCVPDMLGGTVLGYVTLV